MQGYQPTCFPKWGGGTISEPVPYPLHGKYPHVRCIHVHVIHPLTLRNTSISEIQDNFGLPGKLKVYERSSFSTKIMFTPTIVFHSSRCALKLKHLLQPLQINHTSSAQPAQEVESVLPLYSASSDSVFFSFSVCPRLVFNLENFHSWYSLFSYSNFPLHTWLCLALLPVQVYAAQLCSKTDPSKQNH